MNDPFRTSKTLARTPPQQKPTVEAIQKIDSQPENSAQARGLNSASSTAKLNTRTDRRAVLSTIAPSSQASPVQNPSSIALASESAHPFGSRGGLQRTPLKTNVVSSKPTAFEDTASLASSGADRSNYINPFHSKGGFQRTPPPILPAQDTLKTNQVKADQNISQNSISTTSVHKDAALPSNTVEKTSENIATRKPGEKLLRTPPPGLNLSSSRQTLGSITTSSNDAINPTLVSTLPLSTSSIPDRLNEDDHAFLAQQHLAAQYKHLKDELAQFMRLHQSCQQQYELLESQASKVIADVKLVNEEPLALLESLHSAGIDTVAQGGLQGLSNPDRLKEYESILKKKIRVLTEQLKTRFRSLHEMEAQERDRRNKLEEAKRQATMDLNTLKQQLELDQLNAQERIAKAKHQLEQVSQGDSGARKQLAELELQQAQLHELNQTRSLLQTQLVNVQPSQSEVEEERCERLLRRVTLYIQRYRSLQNNRAIIQSMQQRLL